MYNTAWQYMPMQEHTLQVGTRSTGKHITGGSEAMDRAYLETAFRRMSTMKYVDKFSLRGSACVADSACPTCSDVQLRMISRDLECKKILSGAIELTLGSVQHNVHTMKWQWLGFCGRAAIFE